VKSRYEESGVSIERGDELVQRLRQHSSVIGGFAGLFPLGDGPDDDILVGCTDGIGTKIELGIKTGRIKGLGQDLVAMCVNDLAVTGARPLFFLDYYATSTLDVDAAELFIAGIREALAACGTVLLGGETAEMPGFYQKGHFDAAGFAVGMVRRSSLIDGSTIQAGDVLAALPSSGLHSNGYSLVRKLVADGLVSLDAQAFGEPTGTLWSEVLLRPTRLYVQDAKKAVATGHIKGMAHITGGGLSNIQRVLPPGHAPDIDYESIKTPPYMRELARLARMDEAESHQVWNMGVGYVLVLDPQHLQKLASLFPDLFVIGTVVKQS
jgi:phosphoribosylformylglycinamidine cyclo-ligase